MIVEGKKSLFLTGTAVLLADDREQAWASRAVEPNPALSWVLGKYVEADNANSNRQYWSLGDLQAAQATIKHAPMNILHRPRAVVGHYVDTEMMYHTVESEDPTGELAAESDNNPFIEALAVFYKYYFPEEFKVVEAAFNMGSLFYSMECVAQSVTCFGDLGCGEEFAYAGPTSDTYCAHINGGISAKKLNQPHFLGGALIIPPALPGWNKAEVKDLSKLILAEEEQAEALYQEIANSAPEADSKTWESVMTVILQMASTTSSA